VPAEIELSVLAKSDLDCIWDYIAADSPIAADRLIDRIEDMIEMLARHPLLGRPRSELSPGLRSFAVGEYLIFYFARQHKLLVARVLSGYRNLDWFFDDLPL
jgi:toxin ParE1/3/4